MWEGGRAGASVENRRVKVIKLVNYHRCDKAQVEFVKHHGWEAKVFQDGIKLCYWDKGQWFVWTNRNGRSGQGEYRPV